MKDFDKLTQFLLPILTITAFMLTSFKKPEVGLIVQLVAQILWIYLGYQAWKKANQFGIFVTAIVITAIVIYGIINYWFL